MSESIVAEFERSVERLLGQTLWGIVPGDGTAVSMELGDKVRRVERLRNSSLPEEIRSYEGRFSLFVTCPWRVETPAAIVCGSGDDLSQDSESERALNAIAGASVMAARATPPVFDLVLQLDNGHTLRTFCEVGHPSNEDNYSIFVDESVYTVGAASTVRRELRSPNPARNVRVVE